METFDPPSLHIKFIPKTLPVPLLKILGRLLSKNIAYEYAMDYGEDIKNRLYGYSIPMIVDLLAPALVEVRSLYAQHNNPYLLPTQAIKDECKNDELELARQAEAYNKNHKWTRPVEFVVTVPDEYLPNEEDRNGNIFTIRID